MSGVEGVRARIRDEIARLGPMRFDRYMELALYGPGGYYERPPVGREGDFVTGPHVHPVFGELLARGIREVWELLGGPDPFRVVELGAGDGTLARLVLGSLRDLPLSLSAVEASAGARELLREIEGVEVTDTPTADPHLVLGHELLDNLPFRLVAGDREVRVGIEGDRLVRVATPADPELAALARAGGREGDGQEGRAIPTGALGLIDELAAAIRRGYALFIDYGGEHGSGGPVHGYRNHRLVEDVLAEPGATDVTAGVDFGLLADAARARGLQAFPTVSQRLALTTLGFADWMRGELAAQGDLLNRGEGLEAVRRWAGRSSGSILVDPAALGRLRWFAIASTGLPRPSFLVPEGGET